jgi:hypothetical protein
MMRAAIKLFVLRAIAPLAFAGAYLDSIGTSNTLPTLLATLALTSHLGYDRMMDD